MQAGPAFLAAVVPWTPLETDTARAARWRGRPPAHGRTRHLGRGPSRAAARQNFTAGWGVCDIVSRAAGEAEAADASGTAVWLRKRFAISA